HDRFRSDSEPLITAVDQALKEARAERRKRGWKMWLSVAGVVTVVTLVVVAAILFNSPLLARHPTPIIGSRVVPLVVAGLVLVFIYLNFRRHALRGGYGFLSDYGCDPKQAHGRVATLAQTYGIKDFQFYDWFATYSKPTNGPSWPDPFKGKQQIRLETIRAYIDEIHRHGGRAWASVQAVGAEEGNLEGRIAGIFPLRDSDRKHYGHPPEAPRFWSYFLNEAWADRMTGIWGPAVRELGFDGIHWNTLGPIAGNYDSEVNGTHAFLRRARGNLAALGLSQTLNFVNLAWWNPDLVESGVVAFPYAEVLSTAKRKEYYDAMDNPKLKRARIWGVMAFYPRWDKPKGLSDSKVMLARWAEAPKHRLRYLILGDDEKYLVGPYFPEAEPMSPFAKAKMAGVLHFLTSEIYKFLTRFFAPRNG